MWRQCVRGYRICIHTHTHTYTSRVRTVNIKTISTEVSRKCIGNFWYFNPYSIYIREENVFREFYTFEDANVKKFLFQKKKKVSIYLPQSRNPLNRALFRCEILYANEIRTSTQRLTSNSTRISKRLSQTINGSINPNESELIGHRTIYQLC